MSPTIAMIAGGLLLTTPIFGLAMHQSAASQIPIASQTPIERSSDSSRDQKNSISRSVDRSRKGDRLESKKGAVGSSRTVVKVIRSDSMTIVHHDRINEKVPVVHPSANVTLIWKTIPLADLSIQHPIGMIPLLVRTVSPNDASDNRSMIGCDPIASPLAKTSLSKRAGRCIAASGNLLAGLT